MKARVKLDRMPSLTHGDNRAVWFLIFRGENAVGTAVEVQLSRSLLSQKGLDTPEALAAVAAKVLQLHLLGGVPKETYMEALHTKIGVSSYWYPGMPGQPERLDTYQDFEVTLPKPPMGFRTSSGRGR